MSQHFYQVETASDSSQGSVPYDMSDGVKGGVVRLNDDGTSETLGVQSYDSTTPEADTGHPFDYAKDAYGRHVPYSKFAGDTLITLNGTTATLSQFEQLGLAQQREGRWEVADMDALAEESRQKAERQEIAEQESYDLHPEAIETAMSHIIEPVPQPVYDRALASFAETLDISEVDFTSIAQASGISDAKAKEGIAFIAESFAQQVQQELGEDAQAVMSWAKQHREPELKTAMRQLLMERSLSGVRALAAQFSSDCSTPEQENRAVHYLRSQGISVRKVGDQWAVKTDDGETSLQNAFKLGYVRWTRKSKASK